MHNLCFLCLLGITALSRVIENNAYAKFWGVKLMHYGRCASGEWKFTLFVVFEVSLLIIQV